MPNTLTNLTPDLYQALDVVSRELVGMIPSVTLDSGVERAAVGQLVRSHVAPVVAATDITPAVTPPDDGDQNIGNKSITITKARRIPIRWNGEEQRGVNSGAGYQSILGSQFEQAMRTLTNEMEADLTALHTLTSRAFGTAGVTPFASDLTDTANIRKILVDNGAPLSDMKLVINTTAGAKMRTLTQLTKANEAADASLLRQGVLLDVHGMQIRESAQIVDFTNGTGTAYTTDTAGYAVGDTDITLITGADTVQLLEDTDPTSATASSIVWSRVGATTTVRNAIDFGAAPFEGSRSARVIARYLWASTLTAGDMQVAGSLERKLN